MSQDIMWIICKEHKNRTFEGMEAPLYKHRNSFLVYLILEWVNPSMSKFLDFVESFK